MGTSIVVEIARSDGTVIGSEVITVVDPRAPERIVIKLGPMSYEAEIAFVEP